MHSVDTNSLRHLSRRSSKNCELQFANSDRFKENYIDDDSIYNVHNAFYFMVIVSLVMCTCMYKLCLFEFGYTNYIFPCIA